jgi:hypothetical protein
MKFSASPVAVPPTLQRPLLFCALALVAALLVWQLAATFLNNQQIQLDTARANLQTLDARLSAARAAQATHMALARRLATLRAALESPPGNRSDADTPLTQRLTQDPRITHPVVRARASAPTQPPAPGLPTLDIQRLQIDTDLLHEEALLAFTHIVTDSLAHIIPVGCTLSRQEEDAPAPLRASCEFERITLASPANSTQNGAQP